ncbi:hypothetical protein P8A22_35160 [Streptomyces laculatispora]|uniref:Transcriptional regulator n=1 Tax=Streptomyces laculatispora TaxID=887464 RepID=A0ABY9IEP6_9ACTN|nr:hypothetical protein [Streptomyces laculatispora]WLQ44684.1 hypothetical protein P8A22_35160 [Streptomyces laculatispora]
MAVASDAIGERELTWGTQLDVREIAAYVAKYATKSADASGTLDHSLSCRPCQGRGATLLPHGTPLPCTACYGTGQARTHAGLPEHDPETTLVVGHWDYLGSGHSPGAALLAAGVWHRKELERQFAAEEGC